jgi:hypothetical protein
MTVLRRPVRSTPGPRPDKPDLPQTDRSPKNRHAFGAFEDFELKVPEIIVMESETFPITGEGEERVRRSLGGSGGLGRASDNGRYV